MSTRGLIMILNNKKTVATYNHLDSQPSWLGKKLITETSLLLRAYYKNYLKNQASKIAMLDEEMNLGEKSKARQSLLKAVNIIRRKQRKMTKSEKSQLTYFEFEFPSVFTWMCDNSKLTLAKGKTKGRKQREYKIVYAYLRKLQGSLLPYLGNNPFPFMTGYMEFLDNKLYCEYAYCLNFDEDKFEFYDSNKGEGGNRWSPKGAGLNLLFSIPFKEIENNNASKVYDKYFSCT